MPPDHLLRGFCCDDSGFDKTKFTVWVFALPLYVPTTHIHFLFRHRLRDERSCEIWWDLNDSQCAGELLTRIQTRGLPFLDRIDSPTRLVEIAGELPAAQAARKWEAIAYSSLLMDDYAGARDGLDRLVAVLDTTVPWQAEMMDRAMQLREKLGNNGSEAKQLLLEWEQGSLQSLGLR
jgi:hypothetical protein